MKIHSLLATKDMYLFVHVSSFHLIIFRIAEFSLLRLSISFFASPSSPKSPKAKHMGRERAKSARSGERRACCKVWQGNGNPKFMFEMDELENSNQAVNNWPSLTIKPKH